MAADAPPYSTTQGGALFDLVGDERAVLQYPYNLVLGPDGRPWFGSRGRVLSIAADGSLIDHGSGNAPQRAPDGSLWFTGGGLNRVTSDGSVTKVSSTTGHTMVPTLDNRAVVIRDIQTAPGAYQYNFSWIDKDGAVTVVTVPDGPDWFTGNVAGPGGSIWHVDATAGFKWVGLFPDGSTKQLNVPAGATGLAWVNSSRFALDFAYTLNGAKVLARVQPSGDLTPIETGADWIRYQDEDIIWISPGADGPATVHRLADPNWTATVPVDVAELTAMCWQPSTSSVWMSAWDTSTSQHRATLYQVTSAGATVRLDGGNSPYYFGDCLAAADGSVWSNNVANLSFSEFLHVSGDGGKVTYDGYPRNSSGPAVVSSDGDLWLPVGGPSGWPGAAIGHVSHVATDRTAGSDRFAGAAEVAKAAFPNGAPVAYLVSGLDFPDALAAGPAAAKDGGPLLLTTPGVLPAATADQLKALKPGRVVIVGGTSVVSPSVERAVGALLPTATVERRAGSDRFATGRAVVDSAFDSSDRVYVATGRSFPDALAASAAAGAHGDPVVLVDGAASGLDAATRAQIAALKPSAITVVGGADAVSAGIAAQLGSIATTARVSGSDRFATASALAQVAFPTATRAFFASGVNFPDALTGAVWAASAKAPLLTVMPGCVPAATASYLQATDAHDVTLLGGPNALAESVASVKRCDAG